MANDHTLKNTSGQTVSSIGDGLGEAFRVEYFQNKKRTTKWLAWIPMLVF